MGDRGEEQDRAKVTGPAAHSWRSQPSRQAQTSSESTWIGAELWAFSKKKTLLISYTNYLPVSKHKYRRTRGHMQWFLLDCVLTTAAMRCGMRVFGYIWRGFSLPHLEIRFCSALSQTRSLGYVLD